MHAAVAASVSWASIVEKCVRGGWTHNGSATASTRASSEASSSPQSPVHAWKDQEGNEDEEEKTQEKKEDHDDEVESSTGESDSSSDDESSASDSEEDETDAGALRLWQPTQLSESSDKDSLTDESATEPYLLQAVEKVLATWASQGKQLHGTSCFHCVCPPAMSLRDYADRIATYFCCSDACFVLSLMYIKQIKEQHFDFEVNWLNVHRLLVTALVVAAKFHDDTCYSIEYYAEVGGLTASDLSIMEVAFLDMVSWKLAVLPESFDTFREQILVDMVKGEISV